MKHQQLSRKKGRKISNHRCSRSWTNCGCIYSNNIVIVAVVAVDTFVVVVVVVVVAAVDAVVVVVVVVVVAVVLCLWLFFVVVVVVAAVVVVVVAVVVIVVAVAVAVAAVVVGSDVGFRRVRNVLKTPLFTWFCAATCILYWCPQYFVNVAFFTAICSVFRRCSKKNAKPSHASAHFAKCVLQKNEMDCLGTYFTHAQT